MSSSFQLLATFSSSICCTITACLVCAVRVLLLYCWQINVCICVHLDNKLLCFWNKAVNSGVMEKINKELQCAICLNRLVQPKLLPCCQHTFCLQCVTSYFQRCTNRQALCPVCRTSFRLPRGGAVALENNTIVNRLLEITETH